MKQLSTLILHWIQPFSFNTINSLARVRTVQLYELEQSMPSRTAGLLLFSNLLLRRKWENERKHWSSSLKNPVILEQLIWGFNVWVGLTYEN